MYLNEYEVIRCMEGEGMTTILMAVGVLVLILIAVVVWQLIKKRKSVYTYGYQQK